jgi:hypothetical protein
MVAVATLDFMSRGFRDSDSTQQLTDQATASKIEEILKQDREQPSRFELVARSQRFARPLRFMAASQFGQTIYPDRRRGFQPAQL